MIPTGLPDLSRPSRTSTNLRKSKFLRDDIFRNTENNNDYFNVSVNNGKKAGGDGSGSSRFRIVRLHTVREAPPQRKTWLQHYLCRELIGSPNFFHSTVENIELQYRELISNCSPKKGPNRNVFDFLVFWFGF